MSNLTYAIILWISAVIFIVAALIVKNKIWQKVLGVVFLLCGIAAYIFTADVASDYRSRQEEREYMAKGLAELADSIETITIADRTRYENIKEIITEHAKDSEPLVSDPDVSNENYDAVLKKIQNDADEFMAFSNNDSILIDNVLYLYCKDKKTVSINDVLLLCDEYKHRVDNLITVDRIDKILKLKSSQLNPESNWVKQHRLDVYDCLHAEDNLYRFKEMMRNSRYLALVHLEYALKPDIRESDNYGFTTYFDSGFACSKVDVYDLDTAELKESFRVFFTNDEEFRSESITRESLWNNLLGNMSGAVISGLVKRGYAYHTKGDNS